MGTITESAVLDALRAISDPQTGQDIVTLGLVKDLVIHGDQIAFTLEFSNQAPLAKAELHGKARRVVAALPGVSDVKVTMGSRAGSARPSAPPEAALTLPDVRHTIAVSSGKGGVGKSTVAVNTALALRDTGAAVGVVDADIYGPNIPLMVGARGRPGMFNNRIIPVQAYDLRVISIGFFVREGEAVIWRGPMVHSAIQQFLRDVEWGALDYLIFDLPPGTGDAQLSLSQAIPLSGATMVTTPQDVSLLDVRKGLTMFRKMNVPILGIVENMTGFACPHCQQVTPIFGEGGGQKLADEFGVPVLGSIPLDVETRVGGDSGTPIVVARPHSPQAEAFRKVAAALIERLAALPTAKLPTIS